jgi:hypothetical protein
MESKLSQEVEFETSTKNVPVRRNFVAPTLAITTMVGVFVLFYLFSYTQCTAPKEIVFFILGAASQWVNTILTFYFGSSQGSQAKDKIIAESQPANRKLEIKG